jgi:hypothetical protein
LAVLISVFVQSILIPPPLEVVAAIPMLMSGGISAT